MVDTPYDICNRALLKVGGNEITSFEDGTTESLAASRHYESTVRASLARYPWRFASQLTSLGAPLSATPASKWQYAWQLPFDLLTLYGVFRNDRPIEYDRFGETVCCNEDADLVAEYVARAEEAKFAPYFTLALEQDLAATFALVLRRDTNLERSLRAYADNALWPTARHLDSQAQTTRALRSTRLLGARG